MVDKGSDVAAGAVTDGFRDGELEESLGNGLLGEIAQGRGEKSDK